MALRSYFLIWVMLLPFSACGGAAGDLEVTLFGGGGNENSFDVLVSPDGSIYVAGVTTSTDLPVTGGAYDTTFNGETDFFIAKFSGDLSRLLACTYLGGSAEEKKGALALSADGSVYFTGYTMSTDFPVTDGCYDPSFNGGKDAVVVRLDGDLSALTASTYLGGSRNEDYQRIVLEASGNVVVAGDTSSADFPTTPGAYNRRYRSSFDVYVTRLDPALKTVMASTLVGGSMHDMVFGLGIDPHGRISFGGQTGSLDYPTTPGAYDRSYNGNEEDAFVSKLSADFSRLECSTFIGGTGYDNGYAYAVDGDGCSWLSGHADPDFPTTAGVYAESCGGKNKAMFAKLSDDLTELVASTFVSESKSASANGQTILFAGDGSIFLIGYAGRSGLETTSGAIMENTAGGVDMFVMNFSADLTALMASTYFGGDGDDESGWAACLTGDGSVLVSCATTSSNLPVHETAYGKSRKGPSDIFLARLSDDLKKH